MQDIIPPKNQNNRPKKLSLLPAQPGPSVSEPAAKPPEPEETIMLDEKGEETMPKRKLLRKPQPSQWSMDWWRAWSRRRKIITSAIVLVLLAGAATGAALTLSHHVKPAKIVVNGKVLVKPPT